MSVSEVRSAGAAPALVLMAGRLPGFLASLLIPVVLARTFDQATFGTYKQLFLVQATLYLAAQLGMAESLAYFLPGSSQGKGRYVANAVLTLAGAGAIVCAGLVAGEATLARWFHNEALVPHVALTGVMLALLLAAAPIEMTLTARGHYGRAAAAWGLSDLLRSLMFLWPAAIGWGLRGLLVGGVAYAALRLAAALWCLRREFPDDLRPDALLWRRQIAYALPFGAAFLVEVLQGNLHHYVVSSRFDPATFAIYAVGCLQIPLVDFVAGPAGNVLMVRMAGHVGRNDSAAIAGLWLGTVRALALFFVPFVGLLLVTGPRLITLVFTDAYAASVPLFMVWAVANLFAVLPTDAVLRVHARTRFLLATSVVRLVLVIVSIGWFLSGFGLMGAVLATLGGMAAGKTMHLALVRRILRVRWRHILPWRGLATAGMAAMIAAVPASVIAESVAGLSGLVATAATYAAICLAVLAGRGLLGQALPWRLRHLAPAPGRPD